MFPQLLASGRFQTSTPPKEMGFLNVCGQGVFFKEVHPNTPGIHEGENRSFCLEGSLFLKQKS